MDYRIKEHELTLSAPMQFQQHYEARIGIDLEDAMKSVSLLLDLKHVIRPGDRISLCRYNGERLKQCGAIRVVEIGSRAVDFVREGDIFTVPPRKEREDGSLRSHNDRKYFSKRVFGGVFKVVDDKNNEFETFKTKKEADDWAEDMNMRGAA